MWKILLLTLMFVQALSLTVTAQSSDDLTPITPKNITQLTQLTRLGRGSATHLDWHPDGDIIAFGGGWGVWLLNEAFEEVAHFPDISYTQDIAWHPSENILATLHLSEIQFWRISDDFSIAVLERVMPINEAEAWYHYTVLDRCMVWSADGQIIGVGTPPILGRIADEQPVPDDLRRLEFYDAERGDILDITDTKLERLVSARCRYGAISPDTSLETYLRYGYQAGFHFVRMMFASDLTSEPIAEFTQGLSEVYATDWHPSGAYITMIHQFTLQSLTWPDLASGNKHIFFNGFISSLQWSPDGKMLLGGSERTSSAYLWSQQDRHMAYEAIPLMWSGDSYDYGDVHWSPNGELISCTAEYAYWRCDLIDIENHEVIRRITQSQDPYHMSREERYSVIWNASYTRYALFDQETTTIIVAALPAEPVSVIWNIDIGRYVVGEYSTEGGTPLPEIQVTGTFPDYLGMTWDDEQLYINTGEDYAHQMTYRWDAEINMLIEAELPRRFDTLRPLQIQRKDVPDPVYETRVQYDLTVLDLDTDDVLSFHSDIPIPNASICDGNGCKTFVQALHPNQKIAALNTRGGIQFWSLEDGSLLHTLSTERDVASLTWDAEGNRLAAGSMDGTVYVFGIP